MQAVAVSVDGLGLGSVLDPAKERDEVSAEFDARISTFLDESHGSPELVYCCRGLCEALGGNVQDAQRVASIGIKAKGDHENVGGESLNTRQAFAYSRHEGAIVTAVRQRKIEIMPLPLPDTGFIAITGEEHGKPIRIGVHRDRKNVRPLIEDLLGAVSMVNVDVEHGNAFGARQPE
ncbi:hypothetical protein BFX40_10660 [Mesorhizobium sp. SEMIA 3007]|nr:hypothetical protein BFX40_10660 [Mesorhizobium sp. SEMIA 3007]